MKAIWFVSNYPHDANPQGGIFYQILADSVTRCGCPLTIVAPTPSTGPVLPVISSKWKQYSLAPKEEHFDNLDIFRPRYFTMPGETDSRFAHKRIISSCTGFYSRDIQIVHGFGSYPVNYAALQLAQMWNLPYVHTFIGSDVNDYPHRGKHQLEIFKSLARESQKLLAVSDDLCSKIKSIADADASKLFMPVSQPPVVTKSSDDIRRMYGLSPQDFVVLFAGSMIKEKGIHELLAAFDQNALADCRLILAGPDPLNIPIPDKIIKTGVLRHDTLLELMSACNTLVLPSYSEGIPGVIKEAGQMKLPVITTAVGGIREIVDESCGYFIEIQSSSSIADAVLHVKNNPGEARSKAFLLHQRIHAEFDGKVIAQKLIDIYAGVINAYSI